MQYDESNKSTDNIGPRWLEQLDNVFSQVIEALQKSREEIFEINQDCEKQCMLLETELQEINKQIEQAIAAGDKYNKLARQARLRLMEVSRRFDIMTEKDIKNAYETAQALQIKYQEARQLENYLKLRRHKIENQIRQYRSINQKAESLLDTT
ncbi:MAG TPA: hypothetical protein PLG09_11055, partial [Syntrophomonadaceae bacterium]|nr:hypothetical protein [Syntrophomonadaceae bacterium]HPU49814.1 hypothetical protein [Syntrophomonadaceae bacterium]